MSYDITVNGQTSNATSYDAAKNAVLNAAYNLAESLAQPIRNGVYRSPKVTARVNADRLNSSIKVGSGIKFPKAAGSVSGKVGPLSYSITRK